MLPVACPSCGEKGNIPAQLAGKKIRCQKCGASFVAGQGASTPNAPAKSAGDSIEVDGLDESSWHMMPVVVPEMPTPPASASTVAATPSAESPGVPARQYKVLTPKDRWFDGKFDLARLEEALNHYARQGWVVRGMATPQIVGFSGGPREEFVILMER